MVKLSSGKIRIRHRTGRHDALLLSQHFLLHLLILLLVFISSSTTSAFIVSSVNQQTPYNLSIKNTDGPSSVFFTNTIITQLFRPSQRRMTTSLQYGENRGVDAQLLFDTWEWTANLGAPAALVAGAVLATMVESREYMSPRKNDSFQIRFVKKMCRFLLLSSFGLEVISIFVTTVTGTMLLSHGDAPILKNLDFNSPMGFLKNNFEFEYLTGRVAFLQGLFHWLASVALELLIPRNGEGVAARRMNSFTASALITIMIAMLSFLNRHMTFYTNYMHMLRRYMVVCFRQFIWPLKPLTVLLIPMTIVTTYLGIRAFISPKDLEKDDGEDID